MNEQQNIDELGNFYREAFDGAESPLPAGLTDTVLSKIPKPTTKKEAAAQVPKPSGFEATLSRFGAKRLFYFLVLSGALNVFFLIDWVSEEQSGPKIIEVAVPTNSEPSAIKKEQREPSAISETEPSVNKDAQVTPIQNPANGTELPSTSTPKQELEPLAASGFLPDSVMERAEEAPAEKGPESISEQEAEPQKKVDPHSWEFLKDSLEGGKLFDEKNN